VGPIRRLSAIVFTDLVDSTRLAQANEPRALQLIQDQEDLARPLIAEHRGRLVKSTGDGLLIEFGSALDAVEMAVALQRGVRTRNAGAGVTPMQLRIGVHLGDVNRRGRDILGDAVNIAARVESVAQPGEIVLSESVYEQVHNKIGYSLEALGAQTLKGVRDPIRVFRVRWAAAEAGSPRAPAGMEKGVATRLAVLPLTNISPDPKDEYFADGLTEELIAALSRIQGIRVIARSSVASYKASTKSAAQIGSELGVGSLLEGSVRKAGDRVRISLQLVDVTSQEHAWTETYDRQLADIFAIQSEVAESTAKAIRVELSEGARDYIARPPTSSLRAYELYLQSGFREDAPDERIFRRSRGNLEEAIRLDPTFAGAQARLGNLFVQAAGDWMTHVEGFALARKHITRALELDPELPEAHAALANLVMQSEHDWARAEKEFERALALNPSDTGARMTLATLLTVLGRTDEAERQMWQALETDPASEHPGHFLVESALTRGDIELARERQRTLLLQDGRPDWTHLSFAVTYARLGLVPEARQELREFGPPTTLLMRIGRALVLSLLGEPAEARDLLDDIARNPNLGFVSQDFVAALYAAVGENERALDLIARLAKSGESGLWLRYQIPIFDAIRDDPRFVGALRAMNLDPGAWKRSGRSRTRSASG
jgi:adenylate cyclase